MGRAHIGQGVGTRRQQRPRCDFAPAFAALRQVSQRPLDIEITLLHRHAAAPLFDQRESLDRVGVIGRCRKNRAKFGLGGIELVHGEKGVAKLQARIHILGVCSHPGLEQFNRFAGLACQACGDGFFIGVWLGGGVGRRCGQQSVQARTGKQCRLHGVSFSSLSSRASNSSGMKGFSR